MQRRKQLFYTYFRLKIHFKKSISHKKSHKTRKSIYYLPLNLKTIRENRQQKAAMAFQGISNRKSTENVVQKFEQRVANKELTELPREPRESPLTLFLLQTLITIARLCSAGD